MQIMHLLPGVAIRPNLELKTRPKQLLGSLLLIIALPGLVYKSTFKAKIDLKKDINIQHISLFKTHCLKKRKWTNENFLSNKLECLSKIDTSSALAY